MIPKIGTKLTKQNHKLLEAIAKSCRSSILQMTTNADSGHPGGSLSTIDYLAVLYAFLISQKGKDVVVSNGHISPAVYAVLAEMGYINKNKVIKSFRKDGSIFEGHVTRHVPGVMYGTGPLGIGISAASGFALSKKLLGKKDKVYGIIGDGESQEGQVYEMMNFASKYKLNNFVVFVDYNRVQLTDSLKKIMPTNIKGHFKASDWEIYEINGHDYNKIWEILGKAEKANKPVLIIGETIMGKGSKFMEPDGKKHIPTWHGKAAKPEEIEEDIELLKLTKDEEELIKQFHKKIKWKPLEYKEPKKLSEVKIKKPKLKIYKKDELTDCRSAYGETLQELAKKNKNIVALTADLSGSVKTNKLGGEFPERHIECGIAEQQMVSCASGMSLRGIIPFASTFGAFATSRAKDQVRVNDINPGTNLKLVSTHCGLSVGEDGPTHQAIDDMGTMMGHFNTHVIEPADPNQCAHMTEYIASHHGNYYMRMGRHKLPILINQAGKPLFSEGYKYKYGKCDILREGKNITIASSGPMVHIAQEAVRNLTENGKISESEVEIIIMTSPKKFDSQLIDSISKTKKLVSIEDHNPFSGYASSISRKIVEKNLSIKKYIPLGVESYQLSGKPKELYERAGIGICNLEKIILSLASPKRKVIPFW